MLTITYAPDGSVGWGSGLVLCSTSRSLAELSVEFNHQRQVTIFQLAASLGTGLAALAQDNGNQRNTLSLRVRRGVDFTNTAFVEPEQALAFTLGQPASFPTTGALMISPVGSVTSTKYGPFYLLNVAIRGVRNKFEDLGVAPAFDYTFDGGLITTTSPY